MTRLRKKTIIVNFPAEFSEVKARELIEKWNPDEIASGIINNNPVIWAVKKPIFDRNITQLEAKGIEFKDGSDVDKEELFAKIDHIDKENPQRILLEKFDQDCSIIEKSSIPFDKVHEPNIKEEFSEINENENLKNDIENFQMKIKEIESEYNQEIQNMKNIIKNLEQEVIDIQEMNSSLEEQLASSNKGNSKTEYQKLWDRFVISDERNIELDTENCKLTRKIKQLEKEIESLKKTSNKDTQ